MSTNSTNAEKAKQGLTSAFGDILNSFQLLGYDTPNDPNFSGTAERAAKGLLELVQDRGDIENKISEMLEKTFPAEYDGMVISKHNVTFGICPHHILPVIYRISVAYIPDEKVIGISKLSRMCQLLGRQPILQEQLTNDLAHILHERMSSKGSAVYVEGLHMCMASRGVQAHEARVVTSTIRGVFKSTATRKEFLDLVTTSHPSLI
jgi:GTP cyclohydrolase I